MKVLHIESGKHLYGGAQQVRYLLENLPKEDVENVLVCDDRSTIRKICESLGINTAPIRIRGDLDLTFPFKLYKICKSEQPDLIHVHSRKGADFWGGWIANRLRIPCVLSRRVDNPEPKWMVKLKYSMYDRIITISEGIRQVLLKEGLPSNQVTLVRSVVDFASFPQPISKHSFQERFKISDSNVVIGCSAQLIERKGHRFLLNALPEVVAKFPNIKVLIFGKGSEESKLKELTAKLGLDKIVSFPGFVDDINSIYPHFDILVHPALMEGLGVALIEASYCKLPIIAGKAGGIPEIVINGKNGYLVHPEEVTPIRDHLLKLLENPELRISMGKFGHTYVCEEFSVHPMVAGNHQVYKEIIATTKA